MIVSIYVEKTFHKIQYHFMLKTQNKVGIEGKIHNIKQYNKKPNVNITLNGERLEAFSLRSGSTQG